MSDERTLLIRTARGHGPSARRLWDLYAPRLIAYARTLLAAQGAQDQAEDVVQIAMCKVLQVRRSKLKEIEAVGPWLYTIVRTTALNHMRGERRERKRRVHAKVQSALGPPTSYESIRRAVERLPSDEAEVVSLRHVGCLTFDQISEILAIPRSTAASRHARAIDRLRAFLAELDEPVRTVEGAKHV
ncbi:MAG: RNA polymerase sigma factor [Phycisphaerales bacterium JB061]